MGRALNVDASTVGQAFMRAEFQVRPRRGQGEPKKPDTTPSIPATGFDNATGEIKSVDGQ